MVKKLISLETENKDLDELIIQEYPGRIYEKNRKVNCLGGRRYFCYYGLEEEVLRRFLANNRVVDGFKINQFLGYPIKDDCGVSLN